MVTDSLGIKIELVGLMARRTSKSWPSADAPKDTPSAIGLENPLASTHRHAKSPSAERLFKATPNLNPP
jgi:hypothetical protein